jgi:hypothetical protein
LHLVTVRIEGCAVVELNADQFEPSGSLRASDEVDLSIIQSDELLGPPRRYCRASPRQSCL